MILKFLRWIAKLRHRVTLLSVLQTQVIATKIRIIMNYDSCVKRKNQLDATYFII